MLGEQIKVRAALTVRRCYGVLAILLVTLVAAAPAHADFAAGQAAYDAGDYAKAYAEWLPLARGGDAAAQYNLGLMYDNGQGVPGSRTEAVRWYRMAADQGNAAAQNNLQETLATLESRLSLVFRMWVRRDGFVDESAQRAFARFRDAANVGLADAQYYLGFMYANGRGVQQDYAEAVRWYRLAADQGQAKAQFYLANMYHNGQGVPQNYAEAARWFRLVADQGDGNAQYNLGLMYDNGRGVPQSRTEAVRWYRLAAGQGVAEAQFGLGVMYAKGQGVPQNYAEAVRWFRLAADQGHALAQYNLGLMYVKGHGVPQDYIQAHMWWNLAASRQTDPAMRDDATENRDIVAGKMTPAQIAEAQRLASAWRPK